MGWLWCEPSGADLTFALGTSLGAKYVHAPAPNDDKSSCSGNLDPPRRDPAHLAAPPRRDPAHLATTLPGASGTRSMDRPGLARRWPLVERHRQRSRKTLLAGLIRQSSGRRSYWSAADASLGTPIAASAAR